MARHRPSFRFPSPAPLFSTTRIVPGPPMKTTYKPLKNPSYLVRSRYGFYFRIRILSDLTLVSSERIAGLTADRRAIEAKFRSVRMAAFVMELFRCIRAGRGRPMDLDLRELKRMLREELSKKVGASEPINAIVIMSPQMSYNEDRPHRTSSNTSRLFPASGNRFFLPRPQSPTV